MSIYEKSRAYKVRYEGADYLAVNDGTSDGQSWAINGGWVYNSRAVTDVRPLVLLDPEDARVKAFLAAKWAGTMAYSLAALIRAQITPPRIPEPGWGAVVRATGDVFAGTGLWQRGHVYWISDEGYTARWAALIDPVLVRPAVNVEETP